MRASGGPSISAVPADANGILKSSVSFRNVHARGGAAARAPLKTAWLMIRIWCERKAGG
jgi:hypothetical protein